MKVPGITHSTWAVHASTCHSLTKLTRKKCCLLMDSICCGILPFTVKEQYTSNTRVRVAQGPVRVCSHIPSATHHPKMSKTAQTRRAVCAGHPGGHPVVCGGDWVRIRNVSFVVYPPPLGRGSWRCVPVRQIPEIRPQKPSRHKFCMEEATHYLVWVRADGTGDGVPSPGRAEECRHRLRHGA